MNGLILLKKLFSFSEIVVGCNYQLSWKGKGGHGANWEGESSFMVFFHVFVILEEAAWPSG